MAKHDIPSIDMIQETRISPEDETDVSINDKVNNLLKFFDETGIRYNDFDIDADPDLLKGLYRKDIAPDKKAYPNVDYYINIPGQRDTQKWLQAVKDIYYSEKNGMGRVFAIRKATQNWDIMDTHDFLNWLKYYEEGAHLKYKMAQLWYENGAPGYFLHVKPDPKKEDASINGKDIDMARDAATDEMSASEKKRIIEKQRNKIIGRLDSAEKLLRTNEGQVFAGKELESLLETIYQLKKKVSMINKMSFSTKIYEDMIVREGNVLNKKGFVKAAEVLFSLARANNPPPPDTGSNDTTVPLPPPPAPPGQGSGSAGGLPSVGPGMAQNPPESAPNEMSPVPKGISDFLENLETGNIGTLDTQKSEDVLEVEDTLNVEDEDLLTVAQELPPPAAPPPEEETQEPPEEAPLEVEEKVPADTILDPKTDNLFEAALSNITINDIITRLETLANLFRTREIPRQLAIIDLMMDKLGISSFFPGLAEASSKSLESNQYALTRLEDILSKLRGTIETPKSQELDLTGKDTNAPELSGLKQKLKTDQEKELNRKRMKKEQENEALEMAANPEKETPSVDLEEDLNKPLPLPRETPPVATPRPAQVR